MFKMFRLLFEIAFYIFILNILLALTFLFNREKFKKRRVELNRIYYTIDRVRGEIEKITKKMEESEDDSSLDKETEELINYMNELKMLYKSAIKLLIS